MALEDNVMALEWYERDAEFYRLAFDHILARPDLFLVRTLSRIRTFFAFDVVLGAELGRAGLVLIGLNALIYCATLGLACLLVFSPGLAGIRRESILVVILAGLVYAAPYFVSFSHPTYNFAVAALIGVLAAVFLRQMLDRPLGALLGAIWASRWRRFALIATLALLVFIQVEWFIRQGAGALG